MAYRVWYSPLKSIILKTYAEVVVYYQMQIATVGHSPSGWEVVEEG